MAASCTIRPQVTNKQGQIVDSKLWDDLRSVLPYAKAREAYLTVKGSNFIDKYGKSSKVQYDENDEPTYSSIANLREFSTIIDMDSRIKAEMRKAKVPEPAVATRENIDKYDDIAIAYNASDSRDKSFVATTDIIDDNGVEKVAVRIFANVGKFSSKVREMVNKRRLNRKLRDMLQQKGVSIEVLSELQQSIRRKTGVTDFESSIVSASGIASTIQLARGRRGEEALPEEFSHFVVEALHSSPIIQRLYSLVLDNNLAQTILGDDYESYQSAYEEQLRADEYTGYKKVFADNANRGITQQEHTELEKMLAYEAIGHLVYERILAAGYVTDVEKLDTGAENLISRLKTQFNRELSTYDLESLYQAINEAQMLSSEFADAIMRGDLFEQVSTENIATSAQFYRLEHEIESKQQLLKRLMDNSRKRYRILRNNEATFDKKKEAKQIKQLEKNYSQREYDAGIMDWAADSLTQIKVLSEQLNTIKETPNIPMNLRTQYLRNIKNYVKSYSVALDCIRYAQNTGVLEESEERDGVLRELSDLTSKLESGYRQYSKPLFIEIIKEFVGDGIVIPYGKNAGHKYTAKELAAIADKDISVMDRWLDSAAESGDWVLKIMDSIAKKAKSESRLDTIEIKKKLLGAYRKLKDAGFSDTEFMYEHDNDGKPIAQYISLKKAKELGGARLEYYKTIIGIKAGLDALLPNDTTKTLHAPVIRKSYFERLKGSLVDGDFGEAFNKTLESIKDTFMRRADDSEFGGRADNTDFEGNPIERLPIYFVRGGENMADLSTDVTSTLMMYAKMANDFNSMNKCVHTLEFMRDNMRERRILKNVNNIYNPVSYNEEDVAAAPTVAESNTGKRADDFFASQVYGRYMKDKTIGDSDISWGKSANALNQITALNKFALNILSGISNVATGSVMMRIEAIAGQWFKYKDLVKADATFWAQITKYLGEIGTEDKTSKLYLFDEMFNVLQDFESEAASKDYQRSRMGHLMQGNTLYFINNAGELWMQNRTALALANNYKLKDAGNNEISLWDALEPVRNEDGVYELKVKDGYTKLDGTKFGRDDIREFTNKAKSINQRMHGIYNYEDRCAIQATAVGRLGLMFRKWIKTSMNRRYGSARYNFDLKETEEGYYRTVGRFMQQSLRDLKAGQFQMLTRFRQLDEYERKNFARAFTEMAHLILIGFAFSLLSGVKGDGDDDELYNSWGFQQLKYQTKRLHTEIGAMAPTPGMIKEAGSILKSPAASINTAQGLLNSIQLLSIPHWISGANTEEITQGKYKGHTKAYKLFWDMPIIPFRETIRRGLNPKEQIAYYM